MDIEKLIEQLRKSADFEDYPIVASFAAIIEKKYLRDAATALSTLQAENEKLRAELENYRKGHCSEGGRREKALAVNGCNYISEKTKRSCPFATFLRQDILTLAQEMDAWYHQHAHMFPGPVLDTIVPAIYGEIRADEYGKLYTTDAQRTGCSMCGFGIHMEDRPHRFDLLWERNPKEWDMWMNHVCQDADGNWYGWGHVLDYIGVKWRNPQQYIDGKRASEAVVQISLFGGDQA